jgi:hypothetical protein
MILIQFDRIMLSGVISIILGEAGFRIKMLTES